MQFGAGVGVDAAEGVVGADFRCVGESLGRDVDGDDLRAGEGQEVLDGVCAEPAGADDDR